MSGKELSSVAYKKGNWMRYILWGAATICIALLISTFFGILNGEISAVVPDGYRFSVTDNYGEGSNVRTTYYIYDNCIMVEDESFDTDSVNRTVIIYDGISTATLALDVEDTTEICELGSCHNSPKVLLTIKKLISHHPGREYIGI